MTRVEVDVERCVGSGQCVVAAPEVFDQSDDDGTVVLLDPHPAGSEVAAARQAAQLCPAAAIAVETQ